MDSDLLKKYQSLLEPPRPGCPGELFCIERFDEVDGSSGAKRAHGPFSLLKELGQGGMACTCLAIDEAIPKLVALKVPLPDEILSPNFTDTFHSEQAAARKLGRAPGKNLVRFEFAGLGGNLRTVPFIAMEYVAGRTLKQKLQEWPNGLPQMDAVRVSVEICFALEVIHATGYTHRDLKPANVILDSLRGERAVVADYGIAASLDQFLKPGGNGGTLAYMAPERFRSVGVDPSVELSPEVDLYSLGCVLFEMLTGSAAFKVRRQSGRVDIVRLLDDMSDISGLHSRLQAIHPRLRSIVFKLLHPKAPKRFSSASEVLERLGRLRFRSLNSGQSTLWRSPTVSENVLDSIRDLASSGYSIPSEWVQGSIGTLLGVVRRKRMSQNVHDIVDQTANMMLIWLSASGGSSTVGREFHDSLRDVCTILRQRRNQILELMNLIADPLGQLRGICENVEEKLDELTKQVERVRTHSDINRIRDVSTRCLYELAHFLIAIAKSDLVEDYAFVNDRLLANIFSAERRL